MSYYAFEGKVREKTHRQGLDCIFLHLHCYIWTIITFIILLYIAQAMVQEAGQVLNYDISVSDSFKSMK